MTDTRQSAHSVVTMPISLTECESQNCNAKTKKGTLGVRTPLWWSDGKAIGRLTLPSRENTARNRARKHEYSSTSD